MQIKTNHLLTKKNFLIVCEKYKVSRGESHLPKIEILNPRNLMSGKLNPQVPQERTKL